MNDPISFVGGIATMVERWLAERTECFDTSGIRNVFELGARLENPINLSIGQPDFETPEAVRRAAIEAIESGKNTYALSQGMPVLREKLLEQIARQYHHDDRDVMVTCGTSGGLVLALMAVVDPGDEVIVFDPFFVMYDALVKMMGGRVRYVDTYPQFRIDPEQVADAIGPKTKAILFNSPGNPTGVVASEEQIAALAQLAAEHNVLLISDEIYSRFCYDEPFVSPARYNQQTLVIDGFSKSHAVPGWRLGFAHGPAALIRQMIKIQQYSFVCAPHPFQVAGAVAMDVDVASHMEAYRRKRDRLVEALADYYELVRPGGAFYVFPRAPWGTGTEFVTQAIEKHQLLIIPGGVFSRRDTHFRISYAAGDEVIDRGIDVLRQLARKR